MRKILVLLLILLWSCEKESFAVTYYVAPTNATPAGHDANFGTLASPWKTINHAYASVTAGDSILLRGGVYTYAMMGYTLIEGTSGTAGNYIYIGPYSNEHPIIDFTGHYSTSYDEILRMEYVEYIKIEGIEFRNYLQSPSGASSHYGINIQQGVNNCIIENCNIHHIGGWGLYISGGSNVSGGQSSNNLILNCDSHHNSDRYSASPWDGADGFLINSYNGQSYISTGNIFRYCRSYWNCDDGWDTNLMDGDVTIEGCWAFWNGFQPGEASGDPDYMVNGGNGEGFKLGNKYSPSITGIRRTVTNCLSFQNYLLGFHQYIPSGQYGFKCVLYNNTSYDNGSGGEFNFGSQTLAQNVLRNNISYGGSNYINAQNDNTFNSWNLGVTVNDMDFVSVSTSGVDGARSVAGNLPDLPFLKLSETSDLIDVGTDVGLSYYGSAPDLGAYEFLGEEIIIPPSEPGVFGILKAWVGGKWVFVKQGNNLVYMTGTSVPNPPTYDYTISGQTYVNTNSSWPGVVIPNTSKVTLGFLNNSITSQNIDGYQLDAGDENAGSTNNNLDGAVITGNKITWVGSPVGVSGVHGVMLGYNINQTVKYNYMDNNPYGVVFKADDNMTDVSGVLAYNIFHDGYLNVRVKGFNGVKIYNNTFYSTGTYPLIFIDGNPTISTGTKIKNNIFYLPSGGFAVYLANGSESGFECDYNLYYCAGSNPNFYYQGSSKTWAEWRALGYDANSVVVNPNFINTTALVPTVRLNYGTNLGVTYQTGLSTAATWVVGTSPGTKNQDAIWQVGARIY